MVVMVVLVRICHNTLDPLMGSLVGLQAVVLVAPMMALEVKVVKVAVVEEVMRTLVT